MNTLLYFRCPRSERPATEALLGAAGLSVMWSDDVAHAIEALQRFEMPVLLDLSADAPALQAAHDIRSHFPSAPIFGVVESGRPDLTTEAIVAGLADVFARPLAGRRVANAIEREKAYQAGQPSRAPEIGADDLCDHSPAMRDVMVLIRRAAATHAGVLIRGEDGTGRQIVARAIHAAQARHGGRFITVDCAALHPNQLDAELFGAAARSQNGDGAAHGLELVSAGSHLYEAAGGTLYLQNVPEAPTRVQARLARLLRDQEARLVETGATLRIDVRAMVAVDAGFDRTVQEGRVRDDLYRRLSFSIDVPPLRHRREDIPALANGFLREIYASLRVPPQPLSRSALLLITALPWRGNAVELRAVLERAVRSAPGRGPWLEDVLAHVRFDEDGVRLANEGTLRQARARFEREHIAAVLNQHQGRIGEAAKALGIQRTNLYRKMRALRVSRDRRV